MYKFVVKIIRELGLHLFSCLSLLLFYCWSPGFFMFCTLFQAEHNKTGLLLQFIFSNGNVDSFYGLLLLSMYITATNFVKAFIS